MNIYVQNNPYRQCIEFWLESRDSKGKKNFAQNIKFEPFGEGLCVPATGDLKYQDAQMLANALWDAGIRPEQSKQSQGATEAQRQHLDDMRAIAFEKLKVNKPNTEGAR